MNIEERLKIVQNPRRPNVLEYIDYLFPSFIEMHGDRVNGDDSAVIGGIATFNGIRVTVIGQIRGRTSTALLK